LKLIDEPLFDNQSIAGLHELINGKGMKAAVKSSMKGKKILPNLGTGL
jgi:hypothetical protein